MLFFKEAGCPNCKTDKSAKVWPKDDFNVFRNLKHISFLGTITELLQCAECGSKFIDVADGHLLHLLSGGDENAFFKFFDAKNFLTNAMTSTLQSIGSPGGIYEYPAEVVTKDGRYFPHAVITLTESIWPISQKTGELHFLSEISSIAPSREAMTLEQREAAYNAPEIQMGAAPIWLIKEDHVFRTQYEQYFIPSKYGSPSSFDLHKNIAGRCQVFDELSVTRFIGPSA